MKVTEHNISEWQLNEGEIKQLIRLVKSEIKNYEHDSAAQTYYGLILGKLLIMKYDKQN